jgi:beta-xylosidase
MNDSSTLAGGADQSDLALGQPMTIGNPIVTNTYTSDPAVLVHDGTAFLYTGHDEAPAGVEDYVMRDWLCFSSTDLVNWQPHGSRLRVTQFEWARDGAKAGAVVERDGKFFWYVAVNHRSIDGGAIGVAVADSPTGPFRDALGTALVTNDVPFDTGDDHTIDPSVIVHDDQAYMFWGKERCFSARLDDSMTSLVGPVLEIDLPGFKEGAHVHERNGWFYLSYGFGYPQRVAYARSRRLSGPWTFEGLVNEVAGNCATNRPAIVEFADDWYFFYHNGVLPGGGSYRRSVCVDRLTYDEDGRMNRVRMTTEGLRAPLPPA